MNTKYALDTPYPQLRGACSPCDIKMLMDLYAGRASELTSITQYLYEHYVIDGLDDNVSECVLGIAKVEMYHHSLLGEAIVKMGGDPIMGGSTCFWSGSNLKYTQNPICFLQNSINAEKLAVSNYRRAAACVKNASLSELLLRIGQDEELHIEILGELLESITN
ncbi:MAG: ferritin-like domain-containing protein [Clostridia bacterium]|nr:ferritin-like domain-containing protein [Clostridia bacterium]